MNEIVANTGAESGIEAQSPICGIVMPISSMGGIYDKAHWERVRVILDEAIRDANHIPRLVSESEDIGVIHARIVQNLYDDPIVICDVSGKNANVMFELGLRLAFNKPTIIIKDDITDYSFDTSPMEHINYRSDLRFDDVRTLQKQIADKIKATLRRVAEDAEYSPFLGHFGKFKVAGLDTKIVGKEEFVLEQLHGIQKEIARLSNKITVIQTAQPTAELYHSLFPSPSSEKFMRWATSDETKAQLMRRLMESTLSEGDEAANRLTDKIMGRTPEK